MIHLRRLRIRKGLTQRQLARRIGVATQQITCYESMTYQPREKIKTRLAEYFGVPPETLFLPDPDAAGLDLSSCRMRRMLCSWCGRFILPTQARYNGIEPDRPYCGRKCIREDLDTRGFDEPRYVPQPSPPSWPPSGHDVMQRVRRVDAMLPGVEG